MANHTLAVQIERTRKILLHEQRTNHQDRAIRPGGIEAFVTRWIEEVGPLCLEAGIDRHVLRLFMGHLRGYRQQDPMQRAASLRAALAILNELDGASQADPLGDLVQPTEP